MRPDLVNDLLQLTGEHLVLVLSAMAVAMLIGVPLGILLTRRAVLRQWLLGLASVMQTIPSLALFGFLIPIPFIGGIGKRTVIIALVLYALLPILRNTFVGIMSVDAAVCESAIAMGMTSGQMLRQVQLPLAAPTILAGVKTAAVINVGTATMAAFIGAGGFGERIVAGLAVNDSTVMLAGAVPAAVLAIVVQVGFDLAERWAGGARFAGRS